MPLHPEVLQLLLRLGLALVAGILFGLDRGEHGKPAGMRTTSLVCLAAAGTMVLVNLLIFTTGKTADSFVQLDMMRLPLGLLSGMGFIGAGAIVRKPRMVEGVTTAATLWFVTIVGLCCGAGVFWLAATLAAVGLGILIILRIIERALPQTHTGELFLTLRDEATEADVRNALGECRIVSWAPAYSHGKLRTLRCIIHWTSPRRDPFPPTAVFEIGRDNRVERARFRPT